MRLKIFLLCLLTGAMMLTGCTRSFDSSGYIIAIMDTLYKGDYTSYARFTGVSTAEASLYRSQWLEEASNQFIQAMGAGTPSEETKSRVTELLKKVYANARYEIADTDDTSGSDSISLTIYPMDLLVANYDAMQNWVNNFNNKNDTFAFASLTEQEFYDTYLDGILTILESQLSSLSWQEAVQLTVSIRQDENGLYTIESEDLAAIQAAILRWPESTEQEETEEGNAEQAETEQQETKQ